MQPLPTGATDAEVIARIDQWASLLERGDYEAAFALTDHLPEFGWTPELIRETVAWCGPYDPNRRVTLGCDPPAPDGRKAVDRWPEPTADGFCGGVCYYLDLDGRASDRVATFLLRDGPDGLTVHFEGIK